MTDDLNGVCGEEDQAMRACDGEAADDERLAAAHARLVVPCCESALAKDAIRGALRRRVERAVWRPEAKLTLSERAEHVLI